MGDSCASRIGIQNSCRMEIGTHHLRRCDRMGVYPFFMPPARLDPELHHLVSESRRGRQHRCSLPASGTNSRFHQGLQPIPSGKLERVSLINSHCCISLTPFNSEKETAVRAKQYISLCSHGQHEAWVPVLKGLRDIRQFAHNSLTRGAGRRVEPEPSQDNEIYISRRVFNKVRSDCPRWR